MNIETVKQKSNGYLVNGSMSVPLDESNKHYQEVKNWISLGNTPTPAFTDAEVAAYNKEQAKQQALETYNQQVKALIGQVPNTELSSWTKQEAEARAFIASSTATTPMLDQLLVSRAVKGETKTILANKIIANADAYAVAYAKVLGEYQAALKAIE